jgi:hypothetical protein
MFLSLPQFLIFTIVLATATATQDEDSTTTSTGIPTSRYMFDGNSAGFHCQNAMNDYSAEDFRLYCINQGQSFLNCASSCTEALHFDGSTGVCKSPGCNFYDLILSTTSTATSSLLKMQDISPPGKVTLFAFAPLWEGHAQYTYEMLEQIQYKYQETTTALFLPIDIHDYELTHPPFELHPYGSSGADDDRTQRVVLLPEIKPHEIVRHAFLNFVRTLLWRDGAQNFDVYTDRPVIFVISQDGFLVKRLVVPTLEELQMTIEGYGGGVSTKVM